MIEASKQDRLAASDAVVAWCLRNAQRKERVGNIEQAALWAYVAAGTAAEFGHSFLCAAPLELLLGRLAQGIGHAPPHPRGGGPRRWLHVMSMSWALGGHTMLAARWIAQAPADERHDLLLTSQSADAIVPALADAVRGGGGRVWSLAQTPALMARAAALRECANEHADVVVLHVHMWDVIPALAFGAAGGPPVLLLNHADHAFWVGCAAADAVVDFRDSGRALTTMLRGARASLLLPVPLPDRGAAPRDRAPAAARLGDPSLLDRELVLLTIGRMVKYRAHPALDFASTAERIVGALDDCALIAVGPDPADERWRALRERTGGRVVAVGEQADLAPWHAAADLYLEGFPIGSYTALLEVGLAARPFVRKPWLAPPEVLPVDRGALDAFAPPRDAHAYATAAITLARDPAGRAALAQAARAAVAHTHCGAGWAAQLDALRRDLPTRHDVGLAFDPRPLPPALASYIAGLRVDARAQAPLEYAQEAATRHGLAPRTDVELLDALRAAERA
jgi:hypothetical protein